MYVLIERWVPVHKSIHTRMNKKKILFNKQVENLVKGRWRKQELLDIYRKIARSTRKELRREKGGVF